ncbi:MAG: hypothetical protein K2X81_08545, partial [Candidatus Obscuribacterales bacterium]|nr:hypothetical protein [Candidatus Obscuribacterales bacterium]
MIKKTLISLLVKTDSDVVLARRRARQIAYLLGFDSHDQTRISTAVSEIARNTIVHAGGGRLSFCIADKQTPCKFIITMEDKGPGIPDIEQILSGRSEHFGLFGASRLVDKFSAINIEKGGTLVQLEKDVPLRQKPFSDNEINELANSLTKLGADNAVDEVHQQNQELLMALEQLSKKQEEIDRASIILAEKNQNLSEMN